jgi:hypothetical protein
MSLAEVPYEAEDVYVTTYGSINCLLGYVRLDILKPVLVGFVERQVGKWPGESFRPEKVTATRIREVLVDPKYGFTKPHTIIGSPKSSLSSLSDLDAHNTNSLQDTGPKRASAIPDASYH